MYKPLVDFAGAGATVPLTGFGYSLAMGAIEAVNKYGLIGALAGGVTRAAAGISAAILLRTAQRADLQAPRKAIKEKRAAAQICAAAQAVKKATESSRGPKSSRI